MGFLHRARWTRQGRTAPAACQLAHPSIRAQSVEQFSESDGGETRRGVGNRVRQNEHAVVDERAARDKEHRFFRVEAKGLPAHYGLIGREPLIFRGTIRIVIHSKVQRNEVRSICEDISIKAKGTQLRACASYGGCVKYEMRSWIPLGKLP